MIQSTDLRINNWFNLNGKDFYIDMKMLYAISSGMPDYDLEKIKPIPLTEEWMLKFGFKQNTPIASREYLLDDLLMVDHYENGFLFKMAWWKTGTFLKHVHQLQNLYFALTGNELTLTPAKEETP